MTFQSWRFEEKSDILGSRLHFTKVNLTRLTRDELWLWKCILFESPKPYLFAQYLKNSIQALLRYEIIAQSNPTSYHTEANGSIFFLAGCKIYIWEDYLQVLLERKMTAMVFDWESKKPSVRGKRRAQGQLFILFIWTFFVKSYQFFNED